MTALPAAKEAPRAALRALLPRRGDLLPLVLAFNTEPARYADASHLAKLGLPPAAVESLRRTPRGLRALSRLLLLQHGLADEAALDFREPRRRLALVDAGTLRALIPFAGAAACAGSIARRIGREDRAALQSELGPEACRYARERAAWPTGGELGAILQAAVRVSGLPDDGGDFAPAAALAEAARRAGTWCLETCFHAEPAALTGRLRLKFPNDPSRAPDFTRVPTPEVVNLSLRVGVGAFLLRLLTREIAPHWTPCFT